MAMLRALSHIGLSERRIRALHEIDIRDISLGKKCAAGMGGAAGRKNGHQVTAFEPRVRYGRGQQGVRLGAARGMERPFE